MSEQAADEEKGQNMSQVRTLKHSQNATLQFLESKQQHGQWTEQECPFKYGVWA